MYIVTVDIAVTPDGLAPFLEAMKLNAQGSRGEPGCLRFDIVQAENDPTRVFLYEVYRTKDDFAFHLTTDHYHRWRAAVGAWLARPNLANFYLNVDPTDDAWPDR